MNRTYPTSGYDLPEKTVLLISCIDLRLTDDLVRFMDHENLTNRYDHFIMAGASLGATLLNQNGWPNNINNHKNGKYDHRQFGFQHWKPTLDAHVKIAIALHEIKDVYIVEHEKCGAYKAFVDATVLKQHQEIGCQTISAQALAQYLQTTYQLHVHCFRMDLRGNVALI